MARPVVLDTNALLLPFTDATDLEHELLGLVGAIDLVVPQPVVQEVATLAEGDGATGRAGRAAQQWMKRCRVEPTDLPGDDGILEVARRLGAVVVTNDRRLQTEAHRSGLTVVSSRGPGRLFIRRGSGVD